MDKKQRSILKDSLAAPDALSLRYLPFFMVITFPFLLIFDHVWELPFQDELRLTLAKTISYGFLYLYFLLIKITCNSRQRRSISIPILFFLSGLGGAFQGIVSGFLIQIFGVKAPISIFERSLTAFFIALTWLPINAVASSAILTFRKNRSEILRRSEQIGRIAFEQAGLAKKIRLQIEGEIVNELNWTREYAHSKFERSLDKGFDATRMNSQFLREYASQDLRAISHKLWNQAEVKSKAILPKKTSEIRSIWELYRMSFYLPPIDSFVQGFILLTLFLPISLRGYPLYSQFEAALVLSIVVFGVLRVGYLLYKRFPNQCPVIIPLRTFSALGFSYILAVVLNNVVATGVPKIPAPSLISALIIFISVDVTMSIAKATLYTQEEQIKALHRSVGRHKAQINMANLEIALVSREWAQHIHGTLASKLLMSAAILEKTVAVTDLTVKEAALAEATQILNRDFVPQQSVKRDLMQEILHRVHQWNPILIIELQGSMDLYFPTISVEKFGLAIEEALANAYRHGQATKVSILLNPLDSQSLECTIIDNGVGLAGYKRDGLGSALFDAIAPGNWSRSAGTGGIGTCIRLLVSAPAIPSAGEST